MVDAEAAARIRTAWARMEPLHAAQMAALDAYADTWSQPFEVGRAAKIRLDWAVVAWLAAGAELIRALGAVEGAPKLMLDGEIALTIGGGTDRLLPGQAAFGPKNVVHWVRNPLDQPVSFLSITTPAGMDRMLLRVEEESAGEGSLDQAVLARLAEQFGVSFV